MLLVLGRRLANVIPTLLAVIALVFLLFSVLPGSFISGMNEDGRSTIDPAVMERMRKEMGLDDPLLERFGKYVAATVTGDLGTSFRTREPVTKMLSNRIWPSLKLVLAAMTFAIAVGVTLGFLAALRPGSWIDTASMVGAISGLSLSQFWFGLMLMYLFALKLQWLPSFGYGDGGLRHLILPAIALGVGPMALLARTTRAAVLDVLNADFVRTARSKGMSERRVVEWHVLRNALVLVITIVGLQFGSLMGQAVVVEKLFAWPGVGSLMVDSVFQRDMPTVQGCILMIVLFFLAINTLVDLAYVVIDPRIRYQ
ncbi:MAG: ABC transporter permease [Alphaproteobacteria bacterium]|jgi:peptide/nickel transport system permease protein|uniref:ABC transporter permease n=1 Tax=Reyranella massiliensis TaxID=445220 RepID=UPI000315F9F7|nr:ABC transporter permease [Reyranella massiliensis]MBN9511920.1 ABC transporter permease [Alphaproteobacteria bacterium]MCA0246860.1 ABC transporter permease [Pseudomonadota bacterium]